MNGDSTVASRPTAAGLEHYLRHRRLYSALLLCTVMVLILVARIATGILDVRQWRVAIEPWELVLWEVSSGIVILALFPAILIFDRYVPITWPNWRRALPKHLLASAVFSIIHVQGMFVLRKLAYAAAGRTYAFDDWIGQWAYEYLKDIRTYFASLFIIYVYRFILLRLQGEASELGVADTDTRIESAAPHDRFLVRKLDKEFLIEAREIQWLEAQGNYVNLHVSGRAYPLRSTMAAIEARLDPRFVRVHRSHIVNIDYLAEIEPLDSGDARLKLRDGALVQCSRTYRVALKERVGKRLQSGVAA